MSVTVLYVLLAVSAQAPSTGDGPLEDLREQGEQGEQHEQHEQHESDAAPEQSTTVVTAARGPRARDETPATTWIIDRESLQRNPALTVDELLRTLPSVGTFRRSSSLVADPTSQGLNLRGVGPSAVSRGLLLVDGVPANDPFGGWIYWRAIPRLSIERIEVVPGGSSALYGSAALGGVVEVVPRAPTAEAADIDLFAGSSRTGGAALHAASALGPAAAAVDLELMTTGGWQVVAPWDRGPIDGPAGSTHGTAAAAAAWDIDEAVRLTLRGGLFQEEQNGGTTFTTAAVRMGHLAVGAELRPGGGSDVQLRAYGRLVELRQDRARVGEGRASEDRAASQRVPAEEVGASAVWSAPPVRGLGAHRLSAGLDVRQVQGTSFEDVNPPGGGIIRREAGGAQQLAGAFVQDHWTLIPGLAVDGALRFDSWRNYEGRRSVVRDGALDERRFDERADSAVSPRLGLVLRPGAGLLLRTSAFHAFRAPTLNELYRPFQVGTVSTAANERLGAERLWGGETAIELRPAPGVLVRAAGFSNILVDPIANVTLDDDEAERVGAARQRRNLGAALVRGLELGLDAPLARLDGRAALHGTLAWTIVDARVVRADAAPDLVGMELPQNPAHRFTAGLVFDEPRLFTAMAQLRFLGPQYEDDLNTLRIDAATLVDVSLRRRLFGPLSLFVAVENLLNQVHVIGRPGIDTLGTPFFARVGLELRS
jgi:iron complex outermembrane recepter protein